MMRKKSQPELVSMEEFFSSTPIAIEDSPLRKRTFGGALAGLAGIVVLALIAGAVVTLPTLYALSAVAQVAEKPVNDFKALPESLEEIAISERNLMYDVNGDVFAEFWSEDRIKLPNLEAIADDAKNALIATEDKRFYEHSGIDLIGTLRAAMRQSGGGSGITQQLVKNLQFYNQAGTEEAKAAATEASLTRKIQELRYAMGYEKEHSKDEILLQYFNTVAFGAPNIYSIESAAQFFFGVSAAELNLAQSAALIGTVKDPSTFSMMSDEYVDWKKRQKVVLARMVDEGYITSEQSEAAASEELVFVRKAPNGNCTSSKYPFYCDYVLDYLMASNEFGETEEDRRAILQRGGLHIHTHLDPRLMHAAQVYIDGDLGQDNRAVAPTAIVEPGTGGVQAIAVNRAYGEGPGKTTINVALNPTATGSTYKGVTLAAAANAGMNESDLAFRSASCPFYMDKYDAPPGGIRNSTSCELQGGYLDYQQATALSSNTWYLTLADRVGMDKVFEMSRNLGLNVPANINNRSISFVIGAYENTPVAMAAAYAAFANDGVFCPATPVKSFEYGDGSRPAVPDTYDPATVGCRAAMSPYAASVVLKSLRANTVPGILPNGFGYMGYIPGQDAVGKTGTNEQYNYAWAQISKKHSLFIDVYDMTTYSQGVAGSVPYKGSWEPINIAAYLGSDIMKAVLDQQPNVPLNYDSQDRTAIVVPKDTRDFFVVPNVLGLTPAEALGSLEGLSMKSHVSKETREGPAGFPAGVIAEQSIAPGTVLPIGTKKELILYSNPS